MEGAVSVKGGKTGENAKTNEQQSGNQPRSF